jgi:uncharacterized membrane protein
MIEARDSTDATMYHRDFIKQLDEKTVMTAIHQVEKKTTAQVRVFVSHQHVTDALEAARTQFHLLGMERTRHRNAVLIFIAPESRKFAIFGDVAIDQKCGTDFWQTVRDEVTPQLKAGNITSAVVHAIDRAGKALAEHFPLRGKWQNELPDEIVHH